MSVVNGQPVNANTFNNAFQSLSEKGQPNGYCPLDATGKVDPIYLPDELVSYKGAWDASSNTPFLTDGVGNPGDFYIVSADGTQDLGSGAISFVVGDRVFYNDLGTWEKIGGTAVGSINDLSDVIVAGPVAGQILEWDGVAAWRNVDNVKFDAVDTLAAITALPRAAAKWYFVTDVEGGIPYYDNGVSLVKVISAADLATKKNNEVVTNVAPTVNDDSGAGNFISQLWIDTVTNSQYICVDDTVGAAIWSPIINSVAGSPLNTKGDLFTYDTVDARLPVGTDGQVLVANSLTATGLEWQDSPAGAFDAIDTLANLQLLPRVQGKEYYATDENRIYIDNGVDLVKVPVDAEKVGRYTRAGDPTVNDDVDNGYRPGDILVNTTTDNLWFCADNASGAAIWKEVATVDQLLLATSSGVVTGMEITINGGDPSLVDIAAGLGVVVDWTNPTAPTRSIINYAGATGVALINLGITPVTGFTIDGTGTVVQVGGAASNDKYRDCIILQTAIHPNGVSIDSITDDRVPAYQKIDGLYDYIRKLGVINDGNDFSANGANLQIDKAAGTSTLPFINQINDNQNPAERTNAAQTGLTFNYRYQGTLVAGQTLIDPDNYDVAGVLTAVPNNDYTIQRFYFFGRSDQTTVTYGQATYNTLEDAEEAILTENPVLSPTLDSARFVTALIIQEGTTDIAAAIVAGDAKFVNPASGLIGGGGAGAVDSVFGRTGAVIATEGDYTLDLLGDVDLTTTPPVVDDFIKYDGVDFVPAQVNEVPALSGDPNQYLAGDGTFRDLPPATGGGSGGALYAGRIDAAGDPVSGWEAPSQVATDNEIVNGDFEQPLGAEYTTFTSGGGSVAIVGGELQLNNTGVGQSIIAQTYNTNIGDYYVLNLDASLNRSNLSVNMYEGDQPANPAPVNTPIFTGNTTDNTIVFQATTAQTSLFIGNGTASASATTDNWSVQELKTDCTSQQLANNDFSDGTTNGWQDQSVGAGSISIVNGDELRLTNTAEGSNAGAISQAVNITNGGIFRAIIQTRVFSGGNARFKLTQNADGTGTQYFDSGILFANQTYEYLINTNVTGTAYFYITGTNGGGGTFADIERGEFQELQACENFYGFTTEVNGSNVIVNFDESLNTAVAPLATAEDGTSLAVTNITENSVEIVNALTEDVVFHFAPQNGEGSGGGGASDIINPQDILQSYTFTDISNGSGTAAIIDSTAVDCSTTVAGQFGRVEAELTLKANTNYRINFSANLINNRVRVVTGPNVTGSTLVDFLNSGTGDDLGGEFNSGGNTTAYLVVESTGNASVVEFRNIELNELPSTNIYPTGQNVQLADGTLLPVQRVTFDPNDFANGAVIVPVSTTVIDLNTDFANEALAGGGIGGTIWSDNSVGAGAAIDNTPGNIALSNPVNGQYGVLTRDVTSQLVDGQEYTIEMSAAQAHAQVVISNTLNGTSGNLVSVTTASPATAFTYDSSFPYLVLRLSNTTLGVVNITNVTVNQTTGVRSIVNKGEGDYATATGRDGFGDTNNKGRINTSNELVMVKSAATVAGGEAYIDFTYEQ